MTGIEIDEVDLRNRITFLIWLRTQRFWGLIECLNIYTDILYVTRNKNKETFLKSLRDPESLATLL